MTNEGRESGSGAVLERLIKLHPKIIDLSLDRVFDLLAALGHPEQKLPPVVHVAGTNGKGSTIAFLRAALEAAGHRVQVYSSPHLVRFHERVRMGPGLIDEAFLVELLEHCEAVNQGRPITFFEITTVAALLAFAWDPGDTLLLETGLGGRLDATNVVARPQLCVITPISIDHTQYLGPTLRDIAGEKAGILKADVPAVIAPQSDEALEVLVQKAEAVGAPLFCAGRDWRFEASDKGFEFESGCLRGQFPPPALPGGHQLINAATAVACLSKLNEFALDHRAIERGLQEATWPGRLQRLNNGNLRALLGSGSWDLWLDGGHNAAAGQALADFVAGTSDPSVYVIFGMLNTKAAEDFLAPIVGQVQSVQCIAIPGEPNSLSAEEAAQKAGALGVKALPQASLVAALQHLAEEYQGGRVLICGSLYLAGHVLDLDQRSKGSPLIGGGS
ncbi:MAG: folylpolyglutamate synthase/dihydrofolate synthase family protein [Pseudomonadota bacterium]